MRHEALRHAARRRYWVAGFTLVTALIVGTSPAATNAPSDDVSPAFQSDPALQQYRAIRRMHAKSERFNHEGWMEAFTELDERGFRYRIVSERGSDTVRKKVLKAMLEREQELIAKGQPERSELNAENYTFSPETSGPGCRYILIKPKRKDVTLVDGRAVITEDGRELLRVEGALSKNPSFWTNHVNVTRHYARLDGVRVPIAIESVAKVKFAGLSTLDVEYEYEVINGRPVSNAARMVAANYSSR